jgi:hypothetical protein
VDLTGPRSAFDAPPLKFEESVPVCPPHDREVGECLGKQRVCYLLRNYHLVWSVPELRHYICTFLWADPCWSLNLCTALDDSVIKVYLIAVTNEIGKCPAVSREMHDWWIDFQVDRIKARCFIPSSAHCDLTRPHTPLRCGGYLPNWWEYILDKVGRPGVIRAVDNLFALRQWTPPRPYPVSGIPGYDEKSSYPFIHGGVMEKSLMNHTSPTSLDNLQLWAFTIAYKRWDMLIHLPVANRKHYK